jgi:hypothetical protein
MMNEIIAKVSKGSSMDQIYIPKNRAGGMPVGQYVMVTPLTLMQGRIEQERKYKPYFYNVKKIEPLKLELIAEIFKLLDGINPDNIIITGSFLEPGFRFNDIDILVVKEGKIDAERIQNKIEQLIGIKSHMLSLDSKTLILGLSTDPLYSLMLSRCISRNRLIFKTKRRIEPKLLDFQLLKSKTLIDNFDILNGEEKYYLTMNLIAIFLFIKSNKLSKESVDGSMEEIFGVKIIDIKNNLLEKGEFVGRYKEIYNKTFNLIMGKLR